MPHFLLTSETSFSAAHTLPEVEMCDRFHGHNWNVRLTVRVDEDALDSTGIGIDFRVIEDTVKACISDFDHRYLNDLAEFKEVAPSAENLARIVCGRAKNQLAGHESATVEEVEIWETSQYKVVYRPG